MRIYILILLTALIPTFPGPGKEQSLQCAGIACECGWGMTLNRLENPQIPIFTLQDFAVGTVSLFPPYNSRRRGVCLILPPQLGEGRGGGHPVGENKGLAVKRLKTL